MTSAGFSENGYAVKKPDGGGLLGTQFSGVSAGETADLVNNLNHYADEAGQVWACDGLRSGRYRATQVAGGTSMTSPIHMRRIPLWLVRTRPYGEGDRAGTTTSPADGGPYSLRVKVGGATSTGGSSCTFAIVAGLADDPSSGANWSVAESVVTGGGSVPDNIATGSTTSATEAWLTLSTNVLTMDPALLEAARQSVYTLDASGNIVGVDIYALAVDVFGYTESNGVSPRLYGVYVAEWVGAA